MRLVGIFLLSFFYSISMEGTEFLPLTPTELISCSMSLTQHNRISISGKKIKKVIYPEQALLIKIEDETGQIFVQPIIDSLSKATISLVTTDGIIQDLELNFIEKPSERIFLESPISESEPPESPVCSVLSTTDILECLNQGFIPQGYEVLEELGPWCKLKDGIYYQKLYSLVGEDQVIDILTFWNKTIYKKCLKEVESIDRGVKQVYLNQTCLKGREKTWGLIYRSFL